MDPIVVKNIDNLDDVAKQIVKLIPDYPVIAFQGEMGAGKTTTIKEVCRLLQIEDSITSPTFALVNEYHTNDSSPVFHFDFYRINSIEEAFDFGYEEYFFSGSPCLIEWGERVKEILPEKTLYVNIRIINEHTREFSFEFPQYYQ